MFIDTYTIGTLELELAFDVVDVASDVWRNGGHATTNECILGALIEINDMPAKNYPRLTALILEELGMEE